MACHGTVLAAAAAAADAIPMINDRVRVYGQLVGISEALTGNLLLVGRTVVDFVRRQDALFAGVVIVVVIVDIVMVSGHIQIAPAAINQVMAGTWHMVVAVQVVVMVAAKKRIGATKRACTCSAAAKRAALAASATGGAAHGEIVVAVGAARRMLRMVHMVRVVQQVRLLVQTCVGGEIF